MKVAFITFIANESSRHVASALRDVGITANVFNLSRDCVSKDKLLKYDWVFSYGCSEDSWNKCRINSREAILKCVDKVETFKVLKRNNIPCPSYVLSNKRIPKSWEYVVVRNSRTGRKAEDMEITWRDAATQMDGSLFTEYYEHKYEYRIMVFMGKIVGRYFKKLTVEPNGEEWHRFNLQPAAGFEAMDRDCLDAAKALGIDYVGFDVVANSKTKYQILEANSAPAITDEACKAIIKFFTKGK